MKLLRLLTVDDEPHIHEGLDALIDWESIGFERVGSALNGEEALSLAADLHPDVVLTDIRMPGMDGLELIRQFRESPGLDVDIIVVSGYDEFEYARTAIRFRVSDYLLKPIDEDEFTTILGTIRERRREAAERALPDDDPPASAAVLRLLSGSRDEEVIAAATRTLSLGDDQVFVPLVVVALVSDVSLRDPLTAVTVRDALSATKARDTSEWVVDSSPLSVVALGRVPAAQTSDDRLTLWARGLVNSLQATLARRLVVHYGQPVASVIHLPEALTELRNSLAESPPPMDPGVVAHIGNLGTRRAASIGIESLIDALELADLGKASAALDEIVAPWNASPVPARAIRDWSTQLRFRVSELLGILEAPAEHVPADESIRTAARLAEYLPPSVVAGVARTFVEATVGAVALCRANGRNSLVSLMKRRVDRKYAEEITLTEIAAAYSMNAVYLGQLFRKVEGMGFREYLRARRIREARRLLRDTDLHIPEVSHSVGYRDTDFFVDQFRRETGTTPAAFRLLHATDPRSLR